MMTQQFQTQLNKKFTDLMTKEDFIMTLTKRLELLATDELLASFEWLANVDYVMVEQLSDPDIEYMLEAELDDDGDIIDLVYTHCSYRTSLRNEPTFWVWQSLRDGDFVCTL